jgi:diaminopimelate decarboxylase
MNKFGRLQAIRPLTHVDGVPIAELVERYGSPLFVFSERVMRDRYRELHDALARRWAKVRLAWSYKTNHLGGICRVFHREGAWAEVVSGLEYERAVALGVPPDRIHFNGPYKPEPVLERAIREGATVHADHFDELAMMERIAERTKARPRIAIRVNLSTDTIPAWSRFGFNLESGQAKDAVSRIVAGDRLELVGLHCHLGTFIQETDAYRQAADKLARFANDLRSSFGIRLAFLDLGGGFASHNTLRAQYLPGDQATPSFDRYADALCDGLSALDVPPREQPTLVLETGRALVDDAGYLIATVVANKRLPDGRRSVVLDAGVNVLFTSFWYKHDVVPAQDFRGMMEATVFHGPLCMNIDEMRETTLFPPLSVGERVVFRNVGAYNVTQWMQFIMARPAVALVGADRRHALVRRAETLDDVRRPEEMPEWLA